MATKSKAQSKPAKKSAQASSDKTKSVRFKVKAAKAAAGKVVRAVAKALTRRSEKVEKVDARKAPAAVAAPIPDPAHERLRSGQFTSAVQAYEAGIKMMHGEEFQKAIKCFDSLIMDYPDEPEIQERAKVLLHACEKKIQEKGKTVLRSADDHYNVGIADLNRRALDSAIQHLQHALKLTPKADHVLYALAAANAIQGNRDYALQHLKQAIQHRPENRFLATRDSDFESLYEDPDFKHLVMPTEK